MYASLYVFRFTLFFLLALTSLSPTRFDFFELEQDAIQFAEQSPFTHSTEPVSSTQRTTYDNIEFCVELADGNAVLTKCNLPTQDVVWRSPQGWQVKEAFFSDLNRDGTFELTLLVWRSFKPWPVDRFMPSGGRIDTHQDSEGNSCHLILLAVNDGSPREIWAGSALASPLHSLAAVDLNGDGYQELAAIEYDYNSRSTSGSIVVWKWNGFGFSLVDRKEGPFRSLNILQKDKSTIMLAEQD